MKFTCGTCIRNRSRRRRVYSSLFCLSVVIGLVLAHSFVRADTPLVTLTEGSWFVVANSYDTNSTFLGLTAGHFGQTWNVTVASNVNSTMLNFRVFQNYGLSNATELQNINSTFVGSGTWTLFLDLGASTISSPVYSEVEWTVR